MNDSAPDPPPVSPWRRRGVCLVLSAPAGAGKSSILRALLGPALLGPALHGNDPALTLSVSATTRAPRPNERDGIDYHFTTREGFDALVRDGGMLEHATVFGRSYGTPRAPVEAALAAGRDVAFDIDWQGHRLLRAALPDDVVSVFVLPPSLDALRARLVARAGDAPDEIARRMDAAQGEIGHWDEFDHVIVNRDFDAAVADVGAILRAARTQRRRQAGLPGFVAGLGGA